MTVRRFGCLGAGRQDANQSRRLLALAAIYDGGSRGEAARIGSVGLQTVRLSRQARRACGRSASGPRQRVPQFNAAGPDGLVDGKAPGQAPKLTEAQREALIRIVESGPIAAVHGVVRWRLIDLAQWVWDEFGLSISKQTLSRQLRVMGFRKLSARPRHHARNEYAVEAFKKNSLPSWRRSRATTPRAQG